MLATSKSKIKQGFKAMITLIVGAPKIGKTTFAAQLGDDVYFLAGEKGYDHQEIMVTDVTTYNILVAAVDALTKSSYKTVVFDTIDKIVEVIENEVCIRNKVQAMKDIAYGAGQVASRKMLFAEFDKLRNAGIGIVMTTHQKEKEFKTEAISWTAMGTSLGKSYEEAILGYCDLILYSYKNSADVRMIRTQPNKYIQCAGDRTGKLPATMELNAKKVMEILNQPTPTKG